MNQKKFPPLMRDAVQAGFPSPAEHYIEKELDVKRYGVIVSRGRARGLLLPNLDGVDTAGLSSNELSFIRNQKIGFVFQSFNLISRTTALKNVELPMTYARISKKKRTERAMELLECVGLSKRAYHMPNELSGGQRQRVAIARALANEPPLILADEPTGNLDTAASIEIMEIFSELHKAGATVVVVTHEENIAAFTDRIIRFSDGQILEDRINETPTPVSGRIHTKGLYRNRQNKEEAVC